MMAPAPNAMTRPVQRTLTSSRYASSMPISRVPVATLLHRIASPTDASPRRCPRRPTTRSRGLARGCDARVREGPSTLDEVAVPGGRNEPLAGRPYHRAMHTQRVPVADGIELAVDTWAPATAAGRSFVLVHGLASNARMWDGVAARLAECGHRPLTVDLRGHGRSSKPDAGYEMPTVADDLARLVEVLGLDRPIVAGQSWGGNVVLELAARHPDAVGGIVCVDGGWLEPCAVFPTWEACLAALAPPRLAGL